MFECQYRTADDYSCGAPSTHRAWGAQIPTGWTGDSTMADVIGRLRRTT